MELIHETNEVSVVIQEELLQPYPGIHSLLSVGHSCKEEE